MIRSTLFLNCVVVFLALFLLLVPAQKVSANTIKVDKNCSLTKAIGSANNDSSKARCETGYREDTIVLQDNVELNDELPDITTKIILDGNGHTIYMTARHPAFVIKWGDLTIKNLRVKFSGKNRSGPTIEIKNGSITIIDSQMTRCTGKFKIEKSSGIVQGDSDICGYSADTVNSWFGGAPATPIATSVPSYPHTCATLSGTNATISATLGLQSGVQCQQVDAAGIGIQSVIDAGFIDAVDVWGYVEQGVEICFPQQGAIVFLDAATAPRSQVSVAYFARDGMTCAMLDRPGTVVLVPGQAPTLELPVEAATPQSPESETSVGVPESRSTQCQITTTGNLNLRAAPTMGDNIIGHVLRGTTLTPLSRTVYWNQVDYQGTVGWISNNPRYVQITEACL